MGTAAVVAVAFALGIGLTVALAGRDDGDEATPARPDPAVAADEPSTLEAPEGTPPPRARSAATPEEAVRSFLDAEVAGDFEAAYDFLSDDLRAAFGSPAGYVANHASLVPPVLSYDIESADGQSVRALVEYEPSLDSVVGLVPARARVAWAVAEGDGAFGVDLESSTSEALHPSDEAAPGAVAAWAEARQACDAAEDRQWEGALLGSPDLADGLCDAEGEVTVGGLDRLGPTEGAPFSAAFGDDVGEWSRVVPVESPAPLRAVVAPVGAEWLVIGVLGAGAGAGV